MQLNKPTSQPTIERGDLRLKFMYLQPNICDPLNVHQIYLSHQR